MALDFQEVRKQVKELGQRAPQRERERRTRRDLAQSLLKQYANEAEALRARVDLIVGAHDPALRCALPLGEPLDGRHPQPEIPSQTSVLAADGSQIDLDRHIEVQYGLVNVGAIQIRYGSPEPPTTALRSNLLYGEALYTPTGDITNAVLALRRDLYERTLLAELARGLPAPVVTFTDGPMELWGARAGGEEKSSYQEYLGEYLAALQELRELKVGTAGYVDRPRSSPVVRLLETMIIVDEDLQDIKTLHPLRGVSDLDLYSRILDPGQRSAFFGMQSQSSKSYVGDLALNFFYLNVGREGHPSLARVDIPAWVSDDAGTLASLHAVLVDQCRIMGGRPYPYVLHRAHETAVVSLREKEQVTEMIALELRRQGVEPRGGTPKGAIKSMAGRSRYA
jgi:hypothetical protein